MTAEETLENQEDRQNKQPVRLLLAEDQVMIREALAALLEFEGDMEVVAQVGRGDEVAAAATQTHPEVALLDIEMPGMDGLTAAAALKKHHPDTKIVILTTFGRPGFLRRAMESGCPRSWSRTPRPTSSRRPSAGCWPASGHRPRPGRRRARRRGQPAHPARARRPRGLRGRPDHRRDRRPALPLRGHGAELPVGVHPEDRGQEPRRGTAHRLRARLALTHRMKRVTSSGYLRYPHIHGDLLVFASEDDIWLAPADGGRAWRLTSDRAQVSYPRFSRDGTRIAWTSWRDGNPEVYTADPEGSDASRLTYASDAKTRVTGWTADGEVLAVSATGQPETYMTWAYAVPLEGSPPRRLPFGPVADLALEDAGTALLTGRGNSEMAYWKRYRGGTRGRLWIATDQDPLFTRVLADVDGQLGSPMLIGGRLFFLSDHEGTGNIYSCALDGSDIRRHTDHDGMYVRNPSTDGQRIVYHVAGDIWILDGPDAPEPRRIELTLGSPAAGRAPRLISAQDHLGGLDCDWTGQASVVEVRGTVHWLTHKDGPARALL